MKHKMCSLIVNGAYRQFSNGGLSRGEPGLRIAEAGLADCWCIIGTVEDGIMVRIDRLMEGTRTRCAAESANQTLLVWDR